MSSCPASSRLEGDPAIVDRSFKHLDDEEPGREGRAFVLCPLGALLRFRVAG
jgi:hypothetical protein